MSDTQNPTDGDSENQQIRSTMVNTAVNFLFNPNVIDKPYAHKAAFLRKKGLTDAEIALAFGKAESDPKYKEIQRNNIPNNLPLPPSIPVYRKTVSFWSQLSRISSSLIILGVALFGAHYVYKKYIEPWIFGNNSENEKSVRLEKQLQEMTNSVSQLEKNVSALEDTIKYQKMQMEKFFQNEVSEYCPTPLALKEIKTELGAIKSMLLNRHQFPALPKVSPTIPRWQLPEKALDDAFKQKDGEIEEQHSSVSEDAPTEPQFQFHGENESDIFKQNGEREEVEKISGVQFTESELEKNSLPSS